MQERNLYHIYSTLIGQILIFNIKKFLYKIIIIYKLYVSNKILIYTFYFLHIFYYYNYDLFHF